MLYQEAARMSGNLLCSCEDATIDLSLSFSRLLASGTIKSESQPFFLSVKTQKVSRAVWCLQSTAESNAQAWSLWGRKRWGPKSLYPREAANKSLKLVLFRVANHLYCRLEKERRRSYLDDCHLFLVCASWSCLIDPTVLLGLKSDCF